MELKPSALDLKLLKELISANHLKSIQLRPILEDWKNQTGTSLSMEDFLVAKKLVASNLVKNIVIKLKAEEKPKSIESENAQKPNSKEEAAIDPKEVSTIEMVKSISGFEYERFLGNGSVGGSYLGELTDQNQYVVLKVLKPWLLQREDYLATVDKLLDVLGGNSHPQLITHTKFPLGNGLVVYKAPYFEGESLGNIVRGSGRLEVFTALEVLKKIIEPMKFLERIKRHHLSINPENIFRSSDGTLYIKDYEWCRDFFRSGEDRVSIGSSISFLAPEYYKGEVVDSRADIYSLGVLLFFLLTKRYPFSGTPQAIIEKKDASEILEISEIRRDVPLVVSDLIKWMLQADKNKRPKNFSELMSLIDDLLNKKVREVTARKKAQALSKREMVEKSVLTNNMASDDEKKKKKKIPLGWIVPLFKAVFLLGSFSFIGWILLTSYSSNSGSNAIKEKNEKEKIKIELPPNLLQTQGNSSSDQTSNTAVELETEKAAESQNKVWAADPASQKLQEMIHTEKPTALTKQDFQNRLNQVSSSIEEMKKEKNFAQDQINRAADVQVARIEEERDLYWNEKKVELNDHYSNKEKAQADDLIRKIKIETNEDKEINKRIVELQVRHNAITPEQLFKTLSPESQLRQIEIEDKKNVLAKEHNYDEAHKLLLNAMDKESNEHQKVYYRNEAEFFEHAKNVKKMVLNSDVRPENLIRSLGLDLNGRIETASSKGLHVKDGDEEIIPWDKISSKVMSSLAAIYKPKTLGENISLLIYANRASNHLAMQTALRNIKTDYAAQAETPLVKEIMDNISGVEDELVEDWITGQLSLIKMLKARENEASSKNADELIRELKDEYFTNPVYQKFSKEINELHNK